MNELFIAIDSEDGSVKVFEEFDDLLEYSKEAMYGCNYYSVPIKREFVDIDLFLRGNINND